MEDEKLIKIGVWRNVVNIWTVVFYSVILFDLYFQNGLKEIIIPMSIIYVTILAVYTSQKEFERWHDFNVGRHPGELYIYVWTALIVFLFSFDFFDHEHYEVPDEVFTTYLVVLGILAVTKKSKLNYIKKKGK